MGKKFIAFVTGAAGAFDLSGCVWAQNASRRIRASQVRKLAIKRITRNIDAHSVRNISDRKAIGNDWNNVGICIAKATSTGKIICK